MVHKAIKGVALAVMVATGSAASLMSMQAWSADASSHLDQNARMDQLEARVLKLEAASNKQSGMMQHMMKQTQPMSEHDMGGPMGTMPQPAAPMPPAGGGTPMAPAGGGMGGDM